MLGRTEEIHDIYHNDRRISRRESKSTVTTFVDTTLNSSFGGQ
jgi:hypothetical protein